MGIFTNPTLKHVPGGYIEYAKPSFNPAPGISPNPINVTIDADPGLTRRQPTQPPIIVTPIMYH